MHIIEIHRELSCVYCRTEYRPERRCSQYWTTEFVTWDFSRLPPVGEHRTPLNRLTSRLPSTGCAVVAKARDDERTRKHYYVYDAAHAAAYTFNPTNWSRELMKYFLLPRWWEQEPKKNSLRLSTVRSHHIRRNWIGKSEARRHWL